MAVSIYSLIRIDSVQPMQQTSFILFAPTGAFTARLRCSLIRPWRRCLWTLIFLFLSLIVPAKTDADSTDTVHYRQHNRTLQTKGTVIEFNREGLTIGATNGQKRVIPAEAVIRIESQRTPAQRAARLATKAGQFAKAASSYYRLLESGVEDRNWVQSEILSELVLALRADRKYYRASKAFLQLLRKDPRTPYLRSMPLIWAGGFTPSPQAEATALTWMKNQNPATQLLGSSLLLGTQKSQEAERVLLNLAESSKPPINALARAQWLRTQLPHVSEEKIRYCQQAVEQLPLSLQGGPYYILSRLYAGAGENRKAAVAAMRVAILNEDNPNLAAEALLAAGKASMKAKLPVEAEQIYTELINTYPQSTAAADAKQRKSAIDAAPENDDHT